MKLNAEDGGNRRYILCTNNENNICHDVTYERIKRVIDKEGYEADLSEYEKNIVEWNNTRLKPFKHFAQWVYDTRWCDVNGDVLTGLTQEEAMRRKEKFAIEKHDHSRRRSLLLAGILR